MAADVSRDQLALIRIEGMHCHKCENAIQRALSRQPGVHEVEVDFPTGQASVLYDRGAVTMHELTEAVTEAGYVVTGFAQQQVDPSSQSRFGGTPADV